MHLYVVILTRRNTSCMNACNRFWWGSSTWKRKSRFDSVPCETTMSFSATCKTHLTVGISYTHHEESTFNKRALRRDGAQIYVCMYVSDAVRPIHFAIRLYYIARFTPRIESHDPPRVRSDSDTCKVYLPACLPTWMTRYLRTRKGRGEGSKRDGGMGPM